MIGLILDIIGVATGTIGMVVAGLSYRDKRFIAAKQYLEAFGDPDFLGARKHVYNTPPCDMDIRDEQASLVVNFFHEWGLLAKRRYLPMWVLRMLIRLPLSGSTKCSLKTSKRNVNP